jgi:hypothetical protein
MNPFTKVWFYLLILSIIGYMIVFGAYEGTINITDNDSSSFWWIWILLGLAYALSIAALVLYCIEAYRDWKQYKIDLACGKIAIPDEKIACPVDPIMAQTACGSYTAIAQPPRIVSLSTAGVPMIKEIHNYSVSDYRDIINKEDLNLNTCGKMAPAFSTPTCNTMANSCAPVVNMPMQTVASNMCAGGVCAPQSVYMDNMVAPDYMSMSKSYIPIISI